jgi:hypothetical protein
MRCAVIDPHTRVVINVVIVDAATIDDPNTIPIPPHMPVGIGDTYDFETNTFQLALTQRPLEDVRAEKIAELAQALTLAQDAGTEFEGHVFATDNESQLKFMGILLGAMMDPNYEIDFKTLDRQYVRLTHAQVVQLCMAVKAHVTACFQNDQRLTDLIHGATTVEELDAIDVSEGWPTRFVPAA